ncbi:hypothetical protein ACQB60_40695 [Actinomycetota bacterium Odt1-20B]
MQTGWGKSEKTAEDKYVRWIGESDGIDDVRSELAIRDGDAGEWTVLTSSPAWKT